MTCEVAISCEVHRLCGSNCLRYIDHDDCPSYLGGLNSFCTALSVRIRLEFCSRVPDEGKSSPKSAIEVRLTDDTAPNGKRNESIRVDQIISKS
ncbi:hypothetical protein NQ318_020680 [Aromia moschata]|uniref:Uncharacterized protein n=1 Tax=Aromia moschata TaxID=1265417 RepID=A0AAV8XXI9_9CUCU|nr:hypothetical protein NQ318_020680 [Aromia moschata]